MRLTLLLSPLFMAMNAMIALADPATPDKAEVLDSTPRGGVRTLCEFVDPADLKPLAEIEAFVAAELARRENEVQGTMALDWLKAHNVEKRADSQIVTALAGPIGEFTKGGHNFTILIGPKLAADDKPFMICGWTGGFFPFELTNEQAASLDLKEMGLSANANRRYGKRSAAPVMRLSELAVPEAASLDGGRPIKGTVKLKMLGDFKGNDHVRLRLDLKFPEYTDVRFVAAKGFPIDESTVGFSFAEINPPGGKDKPARGPVAAFLDIVEVSPDGDKSKMVVLTNTLGVMLQVD